MRALIKPQSKEYFKRIEQPVQDVQTTMNNIEMKNVAKTVGIDLSELKNFAWFFDIIAKLKLPSNFTRLLNQTKDEVIYLNEITHQQCMSHPSMLIIKTLFYQALANNKSVYTFIDKQSKLLPFVEEKMLRQCIGLSSKRRDAQKVNLQKDENGKMVMSKFERINPDFKTLLASRSYMLKMLVQKVFTRKQVFGKGKRATAYTNTIAQYKQLIKQSQPQEDNQIQNEQNLELYQRIFQDAAFYYQKQLNNLEHIPSNIINSKQYMESTPENVLKNIFLLNIDKQNIQLYWLARMMDCLPLPPNWSKKKGSSFDSYFFQPQKLLFDIHPSYVYILHQMNRFKEIFNMLGSIRQNYYLNMRQLNFFDFFQRKYTVDMYGYIEKSQKTGNKTKTKTKDHKMLKNQQLSDWMVLQGINNSPIKPEHYILAQYIERFWNGLDFVAQPWSPSISPYGQVIWSSNVNDKSMSINPYRPKLSSIIKNQIKKLPVFKDDILKKQYKKQVLEEQVNDEDQQTLMIHKDKILKERQQFLQYYIKHQDKAMPWPYQLKNQLQFINQRNYFQQIFVSPFELTKDLIKQGQQTPFWLQKCQAKDHTIQYTNLLQFNPQDFQAIKQKITNYALDIIGDHEPHLLQQNQKRLNKISSTDELTKYLNYINDLDLREQRKKQYLQSLRVESQESDIFGSQISRMDIEQVVEDKQQVDQNQKSEQKELSEKQTVKEPSLHSQQSQEIIQQPIQVQIVEQIKVQPARQQYQFLTNFKKKKYFKDYNLQNLELSEIYQKINSSIKKKKRQCKFKTGLINKKVKRQFYNAIKILQQQRKQTDPQNNKNLKNCLLNLILTHLRHIQLPFRVNNKSKKSISKSGDNCSEMNYSEITNYEEFRSQISDYETYQMDELIRQIRQNNKKRSTMQHKTERSQNEHELTKDTIQLQPIYQIKPQIAYDPVLKHVKKVSAEIGQFRSTFNCKINKQTLIGKKLEETSNQPKTSITKTKSVNKLENNQTNYHSTPAPYRSNSLKKLDRIQLQSRFSLTKKEGFGSISKFQTAKPFYRVCLDSTASNFLSKEGILKKGELVVLQAQKSLLSKGRGLQTFISKFY